MKRIQLISLCISILLLLGYNAKSNTGTYEYRIGSGGTSALNLGSSLSCTANSPGSGVTRIQESAYLILGVDYSVVTQTTDYNAIVTLAVTWTTVNGIQNESISLQVNFLNGSTNPKDLAINTKTGAFSVSASITNIVITDLSGNTISSVPTNLYCLSRVIVDRIYPFIAGATTNINPTSFHVSNLDEDMDGAMESLFIQWSQVTGAESYDLEWTFVNNYKYEISNYGSLSLIKPISELYFDFSLNSTRISTTNNSYIIPKLFERGVVIFRIRAVGKSTDSPYHNVFGNWSLNDGRIYINDVEYPNYYVFISAHEADMNWQLTTTFAEDGKRKDVISYFDGGNKNRQTVTRMRSTGAAVVGETIYDLYNRPTIQVLPAPVMLLNVPQANEFHLPELNASSSIHFYRNFNMNEHGTVYTSEDAMEDPNAICDIVTPPMSTLSGASNYYSSLNPGVVDNTISTGEETAFVPDASGYPFSKVLYTNDNTGRIKKQGGVGLEYQINSEHETTYSYGVPQQIELDRLFGSNVGNADHYKKNSVRDANGQVSVSYMDMSDKVVATALVGDAPSNMVNIDSYPSYSSGYLTSDLFNENAFGVSISNHLNTSNSGFIFTKQIVVPANGDYFFDFNFNVEPLDLPCESNICAECVYDCYISVVDECNESVYRYPENGTTLVGSFISSEQGYSFVTSCGNTDGEVINGHSFTLALTPGSYTISKRITVNEDAVDFYVNQYMSSEYASCVQTIDQFIQEYIENVEVEQCAVTWDCQTCIDELGDRDTYIANGPYSNDVNALTYDWRYEECADLCKPLSTCKAGFLSMIQDMQPNGQYAEYLLNNSIQPSEFPLSVFNTNNQLPYSQQYSQVNWKSPRIILNGHEYPYYLNGDGTRSLIPVSVNANTNSTSPPSVPNSYFAVNGVNYVYPEKLINLSDFIANWNSSWASSLVRYHPEYCYYESCKEYNTLAYSNDYLTSDQFDKLLEDAISFNDAVNAGLITANLTGGTINTSNPYNIANWFPSIISGELPYSNESSDLNGADVLYDPFVVRGNSLLEIFSGEESPTYGAQLQTYFNNCQSGLSIEQMAAYIVINEVAPSLVGAANINYGNYFGANLGIGSMYNTNRDKMWTIAKTLYIQKKRELQHRRDALYTINECAAYNACFQNEDFDNSELGFSESLSLAIYQYQPCNEEHIELYQNKTPRFISAAQGVANLQNLLNSDSSFEEVCPGEVILENFLSSLINVHHLTGSSIPISGSEFSNLVPIIVPYASNSEVWNENLFWNAVIQTNELIGVIQNSSGQDLCSIHLSKPEYLTDWNQIIGLQGLRGNEANSLFTVLCRYITDDGNMHTELIDGDLPCMPHLAMCVDHSTEYEICEFFPELNFLINELLDEQIFYTNNEWVSLPENLRSSVGPHIWRKFVNDPMTDILQWKTGNDWDSLGSEFRIRNLAFPNNYLYSGYLSNRMTHLDSIKSTFQGSYNSTVLIGTQIQDATAYCHEYPVFYYHDSEGQGHAETVFLDSIRTKPYYGHLMEANNRMISISQCLDSAFLSARVVEDIVSDILISGVGAPFVLFTDTNQWGYKPIGYGRQLPFLDSIQNWGVISSIVGEPIDTLFIADKFDSLGVGYERIIVQFEECNLELSYYAKEQTVNNESIDYLSLMTRIFNFQLAGEPDQYGNYYEFTFDWDNGCLGLNKVHGKWCVPMKQCSVLAPMAMTPLPEIAAGDSDPCVDLLYSQAYENAYHAYQTWYNDQSDQIANSYRMHCLNSLDENFHMTYPDFEYHYTLYYYDQVGNLVRTIPPDGVKRLPISSDSDVLSVRINEDRTNGTQRVFTVHTLATTYQYNSLNQLIRQAIPDQDNMFIWNESLPIGLPSDFQTAELQFLSSGQGFTGGYELTSSIKRGELFKTFDAGNNWSRLNGLVGASINQIRMLNATLGFAVGNDGIILRTLDGGENWDMLKTYQLFVNQLPTNLLDIQYSTAVLPATSISSVKAIVVGQFGTIIQIENLDSAIPIFEKLEVNFESLSPSMPNFSPKWHFTGITITDSGKFQISGNFNSSLDDQDYGAIFYIPSLQALSPGVNSLILTRYDNTRAPGHKAICTFTNGNNISAYVGDIDGRLFYCENLNASDPEYFQIPTNVTSTFFKLYFSNRLNGVAIIGDEEEHKLYSTSNGGRTWVPRSTGSQFFNDIVEVVRNPQCDGQLIFEGSRLIAVGKNGLVARITVVGGSNPGFGLEIANSPSSAVNLNTAWASLVQPCTNNWYKVRLFVTGSGGKIFTALYGGTASFIPWQDISNASITQEFVEMKIYQKNNSPSDEYPIYTGVLLADSGQLYHIHHNGENPSCADESSCDYASNDNIYTCPNNCAADYLISAYPSSGATGKHFKHLEIEYSTPNANYPRIWALSQESVPSNYYGIVKLQLSANGLDNSPSDLSINSSISFEGEASFFKYAFPITYQGTARLLLGTNNATLYALNIDNSSATLSSNVSGKIIPLSLEDIEYPRRPLGAEYTWANQSSVAVGLNGTQLRCTKSNLSPVWFMPIVNSISNFKDCDMLSPIEWYVVGETGTIMLSKGPAVQTSAIQNNTIYFSGISTDLNAICALQNGLDRMVKAVGDFGVMLYSTSQLDDAFQLLANANEHLYAINSLPTQSEPFASTMLAGGANSSMFETNQLIAARNNNVFIPAILDFNFISANEGYVIADGFSIRHTIDGGNRWRIILPSQALAMEQLHLTKVLTLGSNDALAVGSNSSAPLSCKITGNTLFTENIGVSLANNAAYDLQDLKLDYDGEIWCAGGFTSANVQHALLWKRINGQWAAQGGDVTGTKWRAMHIFPSNGSILLAGTRGKINLFAAGDYADENAFTPTDSDWQNFPYSLSSGTQVTFNDIYFHDDMDGYIVGNHGVLLKTNLPASPTYDESTGLLNPASGYSWQAYNLNTNILGQSVQNDMVINAIWFPNRWNGVWGGSYTVNNSNSTIPTGLIRLINDEANIYSSRFFYDCLGRIAISQNSKQLNNADNNGVKYSYTKYDELGRVKEAGQKTENTGINELKFRNIFGYSVGGYHNMKTLNPSLFEYFINTTSGQRTEVTRTFYDAPMLSAPIASDFAQVNLRKRVSSVIYEALFDGILSTYTHATHYSYDIHGNVNTLLQDFPEMAGFSEEQRFKRIDYSYDLISGNVNQVSYQNTKNDQWYHRYRYDEDNRIIEAFTCQNEWSLNNPLANLNMPASFPFWQRDAAYEYYFHGPLARVELGDIDVQGVDYAYTLQGWLKGVNSTFLREDLDMGRDGYDVEGEYSIHGKTARDAFSYGLRYNASDYKPIDESKWGGTDGAAHWLGHNFIPGIYTENQGYVSNTDLWNGNISAMSTSFWKPLDAFENSSSVSANDQYATQVMRYQYDGLNRLKNAMANRKYSRDDNQWTGDVQGSAYFNSFVYDGNGNILNQVRNNGGSQQVDNLNYQYQKNAEGMLVRNRLYNVGGLDGTQDVATETVDVDGIYKYDELGQLHSDLHDGIDKIVWRVDGKIEGVYHTSESGKPNLQFVYDAMGNRVAKKVINQNGDVKITYYIRDASGNVMSVYERGSAGNSQYMRLTEQHIYGSTRLGMRSADVNIEGNSAEGGLLNVLDVSLLGRPSIRLSRGEKKYELCNHLGNVLMTITDRKLIAVGEHEVYYTAHVVHFSDYYPFGLPMKDETDEYGDRYFQSSADGYRYAFNGKELDNQGMGGGSSTYDYGSRIYNPRLGKFMSVDPKASKFPSWSPYAFCLNNTILLMDPDGQEPIKPQAGTVSGFIAFLNNTSTKMGTLRGSAAQEAMFRLAKIDWSGGKPTPATTAPFNLQADRYIYTEKGGWIDMSHFMFYAGTAYKYKQEKLAAQKAIDNLSSGPIPSTRIPDALYNTAAMDPVGEAVQDGYQQEMTDKVFAKWSSYSYEDLPTDKFAADFGANYFDPNSKLSFGEQIQNYLNNNLKANTPDKAPNYNSLPSVEPTEKPSRTNHSTKPVYTADNP